MKGVKYVTAALCLLLTAVTLSLLTLQAADLPKAVEKTADKTMKVIYTLRKGEDA